MDNNLKWCIDKKIERTIENLKKNNMEAFYVENEAKAVELVKGLINEGDTIGLGGSMTIEETGVLDLIKNGKYNFLDRYKVGLTEAAIKEIHRQSFSADVYLTSSNAVTADGELYNVDGNGNRVAAMIYGPDKVIVVVGVNKIVKSLDEAIDRNREICAPVNAKRLNRSTPCAKVGYCMDCNSKDRICNEYVLIKRQRDKNRIKVIIVGKELGY